MRHPSFIKLTRTSSKAAWHPVKNGQYHEARAWINAGLVRFSNLNTNNPKAEAVKLPLPSVRAPSPPRRNSPRRQRPPAAPPVSRRNATSITINIPNTGWRTTPRVKLVRNSPTQKWRPAANQGSGGAQHITVGYLRNNMLNFKNLNTNDPKVSLKKGPSPANVRRWLNSGNVDPAAWYEHVAEWGYNTKKWVGPARNAYAKYHRTKNLENLIHVIKRSMNNLKENNAKNSRNREIRRILTSNLRKTLAELT